MIRPRAGNLWSVPQLDGSVWAPYDCWAANAASQAAWASDGAVVVAPVTMRSRTKLWTPAAQPTKDQLQKLGPGNLSDERDALIHPDTVAAFRRAGLQAPKVRILGTTTPAIVRGHVLGGRSVGIAFSYATLNRLRPRASGSPDFNGGHAGRLQGLYHRDGTPAVPGDKLKGPGDQWFTDLVEPLQDGRRPGIAKGPQRVPFGMIMRAAAECPVDDKGTQLGAGKVLAMVVWKAARIPTPPVVVTPPPAAVETPEQAVARLTGELAAANQARTDAVAAITQERDDALAEVERLAGLIRALAAAAQDAMSELPAQVQNAANAVAGGDS